MSLLHFVNLFPRGAIGPTSPFNLSILLPPLSLSLLFMYGSLSLSLPSSFYLVILWSVHDIHFVRISRGGFQARKPPPSRGSTWGKRETSNGFALSFPPSPLLLHLPVLHLCLSFSSASICISFSLIVYHPPPSLSLSFLFLFSSSCLSHNLPIHRKVVVPGMRLIPREYQELSKRTEVG